MNAQTIDFEIDPIADQLREHERKVYNKKEMWKRHKAKLLPFIKEMILLGAQVDFDSSSIDMRITGDKQKFLQIVRLHRKHGMKPTMPKKGDTSAAWNVSYPGCSDIILWTFFTSTVCRRVQTGTKMVETPVYETVCDSFVPSQEELASAGMPEVLENRNDVSF